MNFQEWFIITESKEEKALALELAGTQDNYNQLVQAIPQNQKESDPLLVLAAYYLNQSNNLNQTKQDIQDYIQLLKNNKMPLIKVNLQTKKPDTPFDNYLHWTQIIHGHQGEEQAKQAKRFIPTDIDLQNEKPIATSSDGLIKVYQSNSPQQCIILGKGQSFCVSQPGNTMWKSYRDTKGSTFYFVYDNSRQDDLSIVVVDAANYGYELTDAKNTTGTIQNPYDSQKRDSNPQIYLDYLKQKGINTNIFKNIPKSPEEIEEDKRLGKQIDDLNSFMKLSHKDKSNYIGRGHQLTNEQFNYLWDYKFSNLLEQYVKTGRILPDTQLEKIATNKELLKNYTHNRLIAHNHMPITQTEFKLLNNKQKEILIEKSQKPIDEAIHYSYYERIFDGNTTLNFDDVLKLLKNAKVYDQEQFNNNHGQILVEKIRNYKNNINNNVTLKNIIALIRTTPKILFSYPPNTIKLESNTTLSKYALKSIDVMNQLNQILGTNFKFIPQPKDLQTFLNQNITEYINYDQFNNQIFNTDEIISLLGEDNISTYLNSPATIYPADLTRNFLNSETRDVDNAGIYWLSTFMQARDKDTPVNIVEFILKRIPPLNETQLTQILSQYRNGIAQIHNNPIFKFLGKYIKNDLDVNKVGQLLTPEIFKNYTTANKWGKEAQESLKQDINKKTIDTINKIISNNN